MYSCLCIRTQTSKSYTVKRIQSRYSLFHGILPKAIVSLGSNRLLYTGIKCIYRVFPGSVHTRHLSQPTFYIGWPLTDGPGMSATLAATPLLSGFLILSFHVKRRSSNAVLDMWHRNPAWGRMLTVQTRGPYNALVSVLLCEAR